MHCFWPWLVYCKFEVLNYGIGTRNGNVYGIMISGVSNDTKEESVVTISGREFLKIKITLNIWQVRYQL